MTEYDLLPDAVVHVDAHLVIVSVNAAATTLLGASVVPGGDAGALLDPRDRSGRHVWAKGWHRSSGLPGAQRITPQDLTINGAVGELRVNVAGTYLRAEDGAFAGALLVMRPAPRRAREAASGIEIVSTVSHELRSPLTSVKGYTSLLLNRWDRLTDDQKKMMLGQVNHDADRVTRLITELLDISRLEMGRLVLRRQLVDVKALADTVVEKVGLGQPELAATVNFDEAPRVYADPDKLEQVLTNLVENACKYATPLGLRIVGATSPTEVAVSVIDRGEGIPADELPKVFAKFFRRDMSKPTGTGLGLWISRGLVEAHGGRLTASSVLGEGTTFRFTLPIIEFEDTLPS